jgi:hypothetical protein
MKFEEAQDIAYRLAQAVYFRKLKRLVGEAGTRKLADTLARHTVLLMVDNVAIPIKITIDCGSAHKIDDLETAIREANKVTPT